MNEDLFAKFEKIKENEKIVVDNFTKEKEKSRQQRKAFSPRKKHIILLLFSIIMTLPVFVFAGIYIIIQYVVGLFGEETFASFIRGIQEHGLLNVDARIFLLIAELQRHENLFLLLAIVFFVISILLSILLHKSRIKLKIQKEKIQKKKGE